MAGPYPAHIAHAGTALQTPLVDAKTVRQYRTPHSHRIGPLSGSMSQYQTLHRMVEESYTTSDAIR
eukprot:3816328-Rhodomonas_salina.1